MKISEELSDSYLHCLASSNGNVKTVCDALRRAVAENLELKHQFSPQHTVILINRIKRCLACDWNENTDWLAEADKLLRGEK